MIDMLEPSAVTRVTKANNSTLRRLKRKGITIRRGEATVTIRYETPRGNRLPWRLEWTENGQDLSEMSASLEDAKIAADVKLARLAEGMRTLKKQEIDELLGFRQKLAELDKRLAPLGRTLDQVVTDVLNAAQVLPGWSPSSMAGFIRQHHGVKNPTKVADVKDAWLAHLRSSYERAYSQKYISSAERYLGGFCVSYGGRWIHECTTLDILNFLKQFKVSPKDDQPRGDVDQDGKVPASRKTKNHVYNFLRRMFGFAKSVLEALSPHLDTVCERIKAPEFETPTPEVYTPKQLQVIFGVLPDLECVLFVSLQLFAGLRPCEAAKIEKRDIRRRTDGSGYIRIRQEVRKRDPKTGRLRVRERKPPITPPLAALLDAIVLQEGPLIISKCIHGRITELLKANGISRKFDGFRNSYISYRLEDIQDRAQVAYEAGHGVAVQIEHYEGLVESDDVPVYWAIRIPSDGLPYTLNHGIVGTRVVRAHARAKRQRLSVDSEAA